MLLYSIFCPACHLAMRPFYRRAFISNFDKIPLDAPVILAVNHPTGFVDPLVLSSYIKKDLWHMTRGDLFKKKWAAALMTSCNMFPVYRIREGFEDSKRNNAIFDYCAKKLADDQIISIYVEGVSAHEKRLRPMQKGAARIALSAFEKNRQANLQVIPVGANYTYADRTRSEIMFDAGEPIFIAPFFEKYLESPAAATNELTAAIESALRNSMVIIADPKDDALTEHLHQLYRNPIDRPLAPHVSTDQNRLLDEKAIADHVNQLPAAEKAELAAQSEAYFSEIKKAGVSDFGLVQPGWASWAWTILGVFGFLPALLGKILVWPPALLANWVMRKKARKVEFRSSIEMGVGVLGYSVFWFLPIFIAAVCTKSPIWIAAAMLLPIWGYCSMLFFEIMGFRSEARKAQGLPEKERQSLLHLRQRLVEKAFSNLRFGLH